MERSSRFAESAGNVPSQSRTGKCIQRFGCRCPDLFRSLYGAFVFGGLAIIFALLSRGARKKTYGAAHTALLIGTAGVLISVVITIGSFITVSRQYGGFDKFLERYTYTLEQNFGIDLNPGSDNSGTDNGSNGTSIFDNNGSGDYL